MLVMMMFVLSIRKIRVSICHYYYYYASFTDWYAGIKEVVTLTSDLSRKNLETDFDRMETPSGPFYRVHFEVYLTLDGSEFSAMLVCQGEVMGRCKARFR